ncbi:MAG: radical SAM protein [Candidatus Wallbacteria bacterium]|nr:radical SAM protein [Candidatus Wallbacteria bacterium]
MHIRKILFTRLFEKPDFPITTPPTGFLYVPAAICAAYPEIRMDFFDFSLPGESMGQFGKKLAEFRPDCVMFSGTYLERDQFYQAAAAVRELLPGAMTVCGGPLASCSPLEILGSGAVDYIVCGEGEQRVINLLQNLETGKNFCDGIGYKAGPDLHYTQPVKLLEDLDAVHFPKWDLIDFREYSKIPGMNSILRQSPYATVSTSRGCPFSCTYCHKTMGKQFRPRSPESVRDEIEQLVRRFGVREIHFIDDCFNLDLERAKKICRLIIDSKFRIGIAFPNAVKADLLDEELIVLLKKAGCYSVTIAIESITPEIVRLMDKKLDLGKARQNISLLDRHGLFTSAYFIYGFPGETGKSLWKNAVFANRLKIETVSFFRFIPYPGTKISADFFSDLDFSGIPSSQFHFFTESGRFNRSRLSATWLSGFRSAAYFLFYTNPVRIWRVLRKIPRTWTMFSRLPLDIWELVSRIWPDFLRFKV